jgi:hypothetical protein
LDGVGRSGRTSSLRRPVESSSIRPSVSSPPTSAFYQALPHCRKSLSADLSPRPDLLRQLGQRTRLHQEAPRLRRSIPISHLSRDLLAILIFLSQRCIILLLRSPQKIARKYNVLPMFRRRLEKMGVLGGIKPRGRPRNQRPTAQTPLGHRPSGSRSNGARTTTTV